MHVVMMKRDSLNANIHIWLCQNVLHGLVSRLPASRADFIRVGLNILQSLQHTESLINATTKRQVVDGGVLDNTFLVDDIKTTEGNTIWREDAIGFADLTLEVRHQGVSKVTEATFLARSLDPGKMGKLRVDRDTEDFGVELLEFFITVAECSDLSGANKGEIERVEEEDDIFSL